MAIPPDNTSIKNLFPDVVVDNITLADFWRSWQISQEFKDKIKVFDTVAIEEKERWDTLAEKYYGSRSMWWVIPMFNDVDDPFKIYYDKTIPQSINFLKMIKQEDVSLLLGEIRKKRLALG